EVLFGPAVATDASAAVDSILRQANIERVRSNAVWVVEVLVSLPVAFRGKSTAFFKDALKWVREFLGGVVFSAVIHRDEAQEHMHVLVVPILEGRLRGRDYIGDIARLQTIQVDFHASVAARYGLARPPPKTRITVAQKSAAAVAVLEKIEADPSSLSDPRVKAYLLSLIEKDPVELARALDIPIGPVRPRPQKSAHQTDEQIAIAVCGGLDSAQENAIAVSGGVIHTNRYPVYSGLTYPQKQPSALH
ncbi:hypothetical protein KR99_23660, partial [Ralstonia solanacearum]